MQKWGRFGSTGRTAANWSACCRAWARPCELLWAKGLCGIGAAERRIINVLDAAVDPRFRGGSIDKAVGFTTRSMLNVPLIARDGALIGVLQFLDADLAGYDQNSE